MTTWDNFNTLYALDTASLRPRPPLVRHSRFPDPPSPSSPSSPSDEDSSGSSALESPGLHTPPPALFNNFHHHHNNTNNNPHYDPFAPEHCLFDFDFRIQSASWGQPHSPFNLDHASTAIPVPTQPQPQPTPTALVAVSIPSSTVTMPDSHPKSTRSSTASSIPDSPSPTPPTKSTTAKKTRTCMSTKDFVPPDVSGLTKREARLVKNRAAAFLSRQRKREEFECMEVRVAELEQENSRLRALVDTNQNAEIDCEEDVDQPAHSTPRPTKKRARAASDDSATCESSDSASNAQIRDLRASVARLRAQLSESRTRQRELEEHLANLQLDDQDAQPDVKSEQSDSGLDGSLRGEVKSDEEENHDLASSGHVKSGAMSLLVLLCALPSLLAESSSSSSSSATSTSSTTNNLNPHDPMSLDTLTYPYPSFSFPTSFGMSGLGPAHGVQIDHNNELTFGALDLGMGMGMGMGDWMGCQPEMQPHHSDVHSTASEWTRLRFVDEEDSMMDIDATTARLASPLSSLSSLNVEFETSRMGKQVVVRVRRAGGQSKSEDTTFASPETSPSPSHSVSSSTSPFGLSHSYPIVPSSSSTSSSASLASLAPISPITPLTLHHPHSFPHSLPLGDPKTTPRRVRISLRNLPGGEGEGAGAEWEVVEV